MLHNSFASLFFAFSLLITTVFPSFVFAATFQLDTPHNVSVGDMFTILVTLVPQKKERAYTAQFTAHYSTDTAHLEKAVFSNPDLIPLSDPHFQKTNPQTGELTQTAGMAGGMTKPTPFLSLTFLAKKPGMFVLDVAPATRILDAANRNILTATSTATMAIRPAMQTATTSQTKTATASISSFSSSAFNTQTREKNPRFKTASSTQSHKTIREPTRIYLIFSGIFLLFAAIALLYTRHSRYR